MSQDERERIARWIEEYAMWHARRSYGEDEDEVPALLTLADLLADGVRRGEPREEVTSG